MIGSVKSISLARSGVRVMPPMTMSTRPLVMNGTRLFGSTVT